MTSMETSVSFDRTKSLMLKHKLYLTEKISAALSPGPLCGLRYLYACFLDTNLIFIMFIFSML